MAIRKTGVKRGLGGEAEGGDVLEEAHACLASGDTAGARVRLVQLQKSAPKDREVLLLGALVSAADGDADAAMDGIEEALAADPDDLLLLSTKASFLLHLFGDAEAAIPLLEETRAFVSEADTGDDEEAEDSLAEMFTELSLELAEAREIVGDFDGALTAASEAYEVSSAPEALLAMASARLEAGDLPAARRDVDRALAELPEDPAAHHLLGRIAVCQGDEAAAAQAFAGAAGINAESFPIPPSLSRERFEALVADAVKALPEPASSYLARGALVVETAPELLRLQAHKPALPPTVPVVLEGPPPAGDDPWQEPPERVLVFQRNVEVMAESEEELPDVLQAALSEAIATFLGVDDDDS